MSGDRAENKANDIQSVVRTERFGYGRNADGGSGGRTDGGGVEDRQDRDRDRDRLNWWENNVANITLGTKPNDCLAYALGLEHHHPIISKLSRLEDGLIYIYI